MTFSKGVLFYLLINLLVNSYGAVAREIKEVEVKSAFIYNFIKHISWPDEEQLNDITVSVYKDKSFYQSLNQILTNQRLKDKNIVIEYSENLVKSKQAQLIIIPESLNPKLNEIARQVRQSNSLIITQNSSDKKNVMINFVPDKTTNTLSFEINKSNIVYEKLEVSPQLLLVGGTELDVATLYRETELAMQEMKNREMNMIDNIATLEKKLTIAEAVFSNSKKKLEKNNQTLALQKQQLAQLKSEIETQKQALVEKIKEKEQELVNFTELKNEEIKASQEILKQKNIEVNIRENEIRLMEMSILNNNAKISEQLALIEQQKNDIFSKDEKIKSKNSILLITLVIIISGSFCGVVIIVLFIRNKKVNQQLKKVVKNLENTQSKLVQSEKMASLGVLTTGVAHEINTPLGIIVTSLSIVDDKVLGIEQALKDGKLSKAKLTKTLTEVKQSNQMSTESLERLNTLINNFKEVAADHVIEEARPLNLNEYLPKLMDSFTSELASHNIDYQVICHRPTTIVTISASLAQVITSLVANSITHAFNDAKMVNKNKRITIQVKHTENIEILFEDNGIGMELNVLNNIFEPFFTTRRNQGGVGLGMHIVYNIVQQTLKGEISIDSNVGRGSKVLLALPKDINAV